MADRNRVTPDIPDHPDTDRSAETDDRLDMQHYVHGDPEAPESSDLSSDEDLPEPPD